MFLTFGGYFLYNRYTKIPKEATMTVKAKRFAEQKHEGQFRKFDGAPYVVHPKRVAEIVSQYKSSKEINSLISAALLHDTLEDTDTSYEELQKEFGTLVASLVLELSSDKNEMKKYGGKTEYLIHKTSNMTSWALVIKLADRLDNVSDFDIASPSFVKKYKAQTIQILKALEKKRTLSKTHKTLINSIWDKVAA
jgi:guanosine-3',5'-bis(diphosphate) 3'-pyrophosphohydrolase